MCYKDTDKSTEKEWQQAKRYFSTKIFERKAVFSPFFGRGEICIRVNLSTGQWVYLYTFFSNFRVQNRGEICIHKRSKQEWNLYTKVEGKGCICILYFINLKDFFRVKAKVTFVYFCQISDEICILLVNRELVLWDEPNVRLG